MMNCEQFRALLPDLARDVTAGGRDELLDAAAVKDALEHADACRACDELLEEAESVTAALRSMARADSERQAPARVEKNLLRVLEVRRSLAMHSSYRRRFVLAGAAGTAAVALLGISLVWRAGVPAAGPELSGTPANSAGSEMAPVLSSSARPGDQSDWLSGFGDEEKPTNSFVPLSQTFDPASVDDDTVVRVVLSRAALDKFGLHMESGGSDQVVADLILTNDGTPQAIRVVGQ
jgi:hypothetical protein